jgi:hypothetical protein
MLAGFMEKELGRIFEFEFDPTNLATASLSAPSMYCKGC